MVVRCNGFPKIPAAVQLTSGRWVGCRESACESPWWTLGSALFGRDGDLFILPLGLVEHLSGDEANLIVRQDKVDVQAKCLPNSPIIGMFLREDLLHAKRRVTCLEIQHTR